MLRRIAQSSMDAETLALGDAFDAAFTLRQDLSLIVGHRVPIHMFTDSAGLCDSVTSGRRTSEGRSMIDLYGTRGLQESGA
jgi:hypothetical protein